MIKAILTDSSYVLLFPKDPLYTGSVNSLYAKEKDQDGFYFWSYFHANKELFAFYKQLLMPVYVFTTGVIQDATEVRDLYQDSFEGVFSGDELGISKADVSSYLSLCETVGVAPAEVLYIDDKIENVEVAGEAGLQVLQYTSNEDVVHKIKELKIGN